MNKHILKGLLGYCQANGCKAKSDAVIEVTGTDLSGKRVKLRKMHLCKRHMCLLLLNEEPNGRD